jgi:hypothetical protein
MTTRRSLLGLTARLAVATLAAAGGLHLGGCGGTGSASMAASSFGWRLASIQGYGNPDVKIQPTDGGATGGSFQIQSSTPQLQAGVPIFMEAIYSATIPNVNPDAFNTGTGATGGAAPPVATFTALWSEVPATEGTTKVVTFNNAVGNTFTGYSPSPSPNVLVTGNSGTFITVSQPGTVKLKLSVVLQAADGSTRDKDFFVDVTVGPAPGA